MILTHRIAHDGSPVMRWMVSNARVKMDEAGNVKPDKRKSNERIDGVVAGIMAAGLAALDDSEDVSPYSEDGPGMLVV